MDRLKQLRESLCDRRLDAPLAVLRVGHDADSLRRFCGWEALLGGSISLIKIWIKIWIRTWNQSWAMLATGMADLPGHWPAQK
jgi:hypothetical protein